MHCTHRWYMSTCKELTLFSYELQHYIHSRYLRRPWALVRTLIADLEVSYYGQYWAMVLILLQPARLKKGRVDICHLWHLKVARLDPVPCVNRQDLLSSLWLYIVQLWYSVTLDTLSAWMSSHSCFDIPRVLIPVAASSHSIIESPYFVSISEPLQSEQLQ